MKKIEKRTLGNLIDALDEYITVNGSNLKNKKGNFIHQVLISCGLASDMSSAQRFTEIYKNDEELGEIYLILKKYPELNMIASASGEIRVLMQKQELKRIKEIRTLLHNGK